MAKKRKKNSKRNIYLAIGITVAILLVAVFIEASGLGGFLKTQVGGAGVCYNHQGVCVPLGGRARAYCTSGSPDNYKYIDTFATSCPAKYKVFRAKKEVYSLNGTSADAVAACEQDLYAQLTKAETDGKTCDPSEDFETEVGPSITNVYETSGTKEAAGLTYVANCIAVGRCDPKPTSTPIPDPKSLCSRDDSEVIHCGTDSRCSPSPTGGYNCPPGQICRVKGIKEGQSVHVGCYAFVNEKQQFSTIADMCQRLASNPPLKDGEQSRQCFYERRDAYDPIANGGNGNGILDPNEGSTGITGECKINASCIGQKECNVSGFDKANCGNPKKLDDRASCQPYVGTLTFSCNS